MKTLATAWPWRVHRGAWDDWSTPHREDDKTSSARMIVDTCGDTVAIPVTCYDGWSNRKKEKDLDEITRLIAKAPQMHALLREILDTSVLTDDRADEVRNILTEIGGTEIEPDQEAAR